MQTNDDLITNPPFRRVLLKFSGEAIAGPESKFGINYTVLRAMCQEVVEATVKLLRPLVTGRPRVTPLLSGVKGFVRPLRAYLVEVGYGRKEIKTETYN